LLRSLLHAAQRFSKSVAKLFLLVRCLEARYLLRVKNVVASPKFGPDFVEDIPWGTHLCLFYDTKEDLIDILVPFFSEGLNSNEACIWVTSEPLTVQAAIAALATVVPRLDAFTRSRQLRILPDTEWHLKGGVFDPDRTVQMWVNAEQEAIRHGFAGVRFGGNTFRIERSLGDTFTYYEAALTAAVNGRHMIALCLYSKQACSGSDVVDVMRNHGSTIIKKGEAWSVVEDAVRRKKADAALQREHEKVLSLNEELRLANKTLEQRVQERASELANSVYQQQPFLNDLSAIVLRVDPQLRITFANDYTLKLLGYAAEEFVNHHLIGTLLPEKESTGRDLEQMAKQVLAHPEQFRHNRNEVITKDGRRLWIEWTNTPQYDEQGTYVGVLSAGIDVTDRIRAEEARRAEGQLHATALYVRSLIEASLDPLVTISADGKITDVNNATEEVTGFSRGELIGSDFSDYFTEPEEARKGYENVFTHGFVRDYPLAIRHRLGKITDVLYNATVYRNEAGDVQGVFASARDVTELKRAEVTARTASLYARSLIEASLDPLVTINPDGKIADVNKATEGTTGRARDELIGSDFCIYFTEPEKARAGYEQVFSDGSVRDYPLALRHKSGRVTDVLYHATTFKNEQGEVQGVFAAARDITGRKRAQEELQRYSDHLEDLVAERTAQLRDAERLAGIGETAAMIGHDLRNPLQGLQYIVDLQKLRFEKLPPEKRSAEDWQKEAELFSKISELVYYMDKIVGDVQDYARPLDPERETVSVDKLIGEVLESLPHSDGKVEINTDLPDLTVEVEPHLMHRVFSNLVLNAIQAMPDGGELSVSASLEDETVAISVSDTGVGIPEEMRDKLFSPLMTRKAKGTGLGLAVVKRIVDAHGGTIQFNSERGNGTTFTITLPAGSVK
jgi:PAS domain S-box-containing protein